MVEGLNYKKKEFEIKYFHIEQVIYIFDGRIPAVSGEIKEYR
jgi:hypothetical protein